MSDQLSKQTRALCRKLEVTGHEVRHDWLGYYLCTEEEAEWEDMGNPSVGFDGRKHYRTITEALRFGLVKLGVEQEA